MSIPIILVRAQEVAGQHAAGRYCDHDLTNFPLDELEVVMEEGLFRPRFYVAYPLPGHLQPYNGESVLDQFRGHLFGPVRVMVPLRGSLSEWDVYQGWLTGREFEAYGHEIEALRNETH